jgi:hypothetical protein
MEEPNRTEIVRRMEAVIAMHPPVKRPVPTHAEKKLKLVKKVA